MFVASWIVMAPGPSQSLAVPAPGQAMARWRRLGQAAGRRPGQVSLEPQPGVHVRESPGPWAKGPGTLGTPTGLLLVNLGKIGSSCFGVCRVIFDDNIKNGGFQEVGTTPPLEKALVN